DTLLAALGDERPRALLLTHIHLDHAGASGTLVERWPGLEVYVLERGAPHMADPARLIDSARRLYGDDMDRLWGDFLAVPEANLHVLTGGETLPGGFEVAYTPGHASHHVSYLHEGTAYVGDVGGVRIPSSPFVLPPTPPPDIDIEAWHSSVDLIAAWHPERLAMTHFGAVEDTAAHHEEMHRRLDEQAELARSGDRDAFLERVSRDVAAAGDPETAAAYTQAAPQDQLFAGLSRYWRKRSEAVGPPLS
ncbi:MAG: MBL fold metallo-hydrolase, partial [Actinomycetota bacterium]|nr:MBL fold metallo-hydrolase [Actinomycetota bacterium]